MKKIFALLIIFSLLSIPPIKSSAQDLPVLSISILTPTNVTGGLPGREETIQATITNNTNQPINDVMAYITMCDLDKHMTVNLEDYSADKPVTIDTLQPGEASKIELPIRLVYVDHFYLYVTVASRNLSQIYSSQPIPIEIIGNTLVSKAAVQVVAIIMPTLLIIITAFILGGYHNRRKILN